MDVGYWTPSNEEWFRKYRAGILAGEKQPKTSGDWSKALRHAVSETRRVLASARILAANSLPPSVVPPNVPPVVVSRPIAEP